MIYSYKRIVETGPLGTERKFKQDENQSCIELGTFDRETYYVYVPDDIIVHEQDEVIEFSPVTLTPELKSELRKLRFAEIKKEFLRKEIDKIGDVHDLIADCMKMVEFTMMLTARITADYLKTEIMDEATRTAYAQRNQAFLDAVNSGQLLIRGDYEDVSELQMRMMTRYSQINHLVKEKYIDELKKIGL